MRYKEIIITFKDLVEGAQSHLSQVAINEYECLGVEELNLDFSESDLEDWQLQSAKEDIKELSQVSQSLKFFYDFENDTFESLITYAKENFNVESVKQIEGDSGDWENEWKKHLEPIVVSDSLQITFITDENDNLEMKDSELKIYPGMGFGTGGHETTFLCLQVMERIIESEAISSCLDYGCGSGILGILAAKRKVAEIDYYDIDDDALINCEQNLKVNKISYLKNSVTSSKKQLADGYDLVMANILLHILLAEKEDIMDKAKKDLVLSGLLKTQEEEILGEYLKDSNFKLKEKVYKNEWMAIHLERVH